MDDYFGVDMIPHWIVQQGFVAKYLIAVIDYQSEYP